VESKFICGGVSVGLNLSEKLKLEDGMGFRNFTRMDPSDFEEHLQWLMERFQKVTQGLEKQFLPQSD